MCRYVQLRLLKMLAFYQARVPGYLHRRLLLRASVLLLTLAASVLTRYDELPYVVAVMALSTAITSWGEFSDTERKLARFGRAAHGLKQLHRWWDGLEPLEQTTAFNIERLVGETEAIIRDECSGWSSSGGKKDEGGEAGGTPRPGEAETGGQAGGGGMEPQPPPSRKAKVAPAAGERW